MSFILKLRAVRLRLRPSYLVRLALLRLDKSPKTPHNLVRLELVTDIESTVVQLRGKTSEVEAGVDKLSDKACASYYDVRVCGSQV